MILDPVKLAVLTVRAPVRAGYGDTISNLANLHLASLLIPRGQGCVSSRPGPASSSPVTLQLWAPVSQHVRPDLGFCVCEGWTLHF